MQLVVALYFPVLPEVAGVPFIISVTAEDANRPTDPLVHGTVDTDDFRPARLDSSGERDLERRRPLFHRHAEDGRHRHPDHHGHRSCPGRQRHQQSYSPSRQHSPASS